MEKEMESAFKRQITRLVGVYISVRMAGGTDQQLAEQQLGKRFYNELQRRGAFSADAPDTFGSGKEILNQLLDGKLALSQNAAATFLELIDAEPSLQADSHTVFGDFWEVANQRGLAILGEAPARKEEKRPDAPIKAPVAALLPATQEEKIRDLADFSKIMKLVLPEDADKTAALAERLNTYPAVIKAWREGKALPPESALNRIAALSKFGDHTKTHLIHARAAARDTMGAMSPQRLRENEAYGGVILNTKLSQLVAQLVGDQSDMLTPSELRTQGRTKSEKHWDAAEALLSLQGPSPVPIPRPMLSNMEDLLGIRGSNRAAIMRETWQYEYGLETFIKKYISGNAPEGKNFGGLVKAYQARMGFSSAQLAEDLGVETGTSQLWIRGEYNPSPESLATIARRHELSADTIETLHALVTGKTLDPIETILKETRREFITEGANAEFVGRRLLKRLVEASRTTLDDISEASGVSEKALKEWIDDSSKETNLCNDGTPKKPRDFRDFILRAAKKAPMEGPLVDRLVAVLVPDEKLRAETADLVMGIPHDIPAGERTAESFLRIAPTRQRFIEMWRHNSRMNTDTFASEHGISTNELSQLGGKGMLSIEKIHEMAAKFGFNTPGTQRQFRKLARDSGGVLQADVNETLDNGGTATAVLNKAAERDGWSGFPELGAAMYDYAIHHPQLSAQCEGITGETLGNTLYLTARKERKETGKPAAEARRQDILDLYERKLAIIVAHAFPDDEERQTRFRELLKNPHQAKTGTSWGNTVSGASHHQAGGKGHA